MSDFDIESQENSFGIFGSDSGGLDPQVTSNINRVATQIQATGMHVVFSCPNCRRRTQIIVEYPELAALSVGLAPQVAGVGSTWSFDQQHNAFFPSASCPTCQHDMPVMISVSEAQQSLNRAIQNQVLPQAHAQQLIQRMSMLKAQAGGGR